MMAAGLNLGKLKASAIKYSPEIAVALGIAGFISTVITAVKVTPKAQKLLEKAKENKVKETEDPNAELTVIEKVKVAGPSYVLPVITGTAAIVCVVFSNRLQAGKIAGLTSTCGLLTQTLNTYQEKVREVIGEKKEKKIQEEIMKDRISASPIPYSMMRPAKMFCGPEIYPCVIANSGDYFWGNLQMVDEIFKELEYRFTQDGGYEEWVPVNDFREAVKLDATNDGRVLGWNLDNLIDGKIPWWHGSINMPDGTPVLAIYFKFSTENNEGINNETPSLW